MALEAFDLLPLADCVLEETFRIADADKIQACVDTLEPYFSVGGDLKVDVSQRFLDGLTGGAFGAIGTLFFTLRKKQEVKDNLVCAYCDGSGHIDCGRCLSHGKMERQGTLVPCTNCEATGMVVCINCQGSGRSLPEDLFQKLGDEEEGFSDDDYIGLFDTKLEKKKKEALFRRVEEVES
jgi:hypothetical protein